MIMEPRKQRCAIAREYIHAIQDGNHDYAARIVKANPDLDKLVEEFEDELRRGV